MMKRPVPVVLSQRVERESNNVYVVYLFTTEDSGKKLYETWHLVLSVRSDTSFTMSLHPSYVFRYRDGWLIVSKEVDSDMDGKVDVVWGYDTEGMWRVLFSK